MNSITLGILIYLGFTLSATILVLIICAQSARVTHAGGQREERKWRSATKVQNGSSPSSNRLPAAN